MALKDKLVNLEDLAVLKDYSDDAFVKSKQGIANKGKALIVGEDGNVTTGDATKVDPTFTQEGKAADAKATGEALDNLIKSKLGIEIEFPDIAEFRELENKVGQKTIKTRIDFDGEKFKLGNEVLNFKRLHDIHLTQPDFAFVVYGDRAYLLSYVQDDTNSMREMRFQSVIAVADGNLSNTKTSGIYVKSTDGINIANISILDVNSENQAYKATTIDDSKKNDVWYPTVKAVAEYIDNGVGADVKEIESKLQPFFIREKLDGTAKTYNAVMREWFLENGVNVTTPKGLTELVEQWYSLTRDNWDGYTKFALPESSTSSEGVKGGDNADMTCVPSTDSVAGQDDYAGLPLFAVTTCNWELDENGDILITAIRGIHQSYEHTNPNKYVGVMQMSGYTYYEEDNEGYKIGYMANMLAEHQNVHPLPEAVKTDGTFRQFILHSKYMSQTVGDKMTSCAGLVPTAYNISHNSLITLAAKNGAMYSGGCVTDWSFLVLMTMIKYGSMTLDNKIQGCVNYNYQYYAKVAESNVNRIILAKNEASNLEVGSTVLIGAYTSSTDRNNSGCYGISGQLGRIITSIEDVTVDDTVYSAVYVSGDKFNTGANGNATAGTTIVSTFHWRSGTNDRVLGNDGSIKNAANGKFPAMLQGIEFAVGAYEVMADVILNIEDGYYVPYIARKKAHQATSVTANMVKSSLKSAQPASNSWNYIRRHGYDGELFFGVDTVGASSSTYTKDAFYKNGVATTSGTREWLAFGSLADGSGFGGLSSLDGVYGLSYARWSVAARFSPNGNRGELVA